MNTLDQKKFVRWEIIGIIVTCILAPVFHFTFDWSGGNRIVGIFSAVNESVWEHSKILTFPFIIYAVIEFFVLKPNARRFWAAKAVAFAFLPLVMIAFFYMYTGMFGAENVIIDIICTFIWLILASVIFQKLYNSGYNLEKYFGWFMVLLFGVLAIELLFTCFPPSIPLFRDSETGLYGFPAA
jgi:hypothetical protein